ncbi:MAG: cell division protein FtsZ [Hyphomicrobium sp.]
MGIKLQLPKLTDLRPRLTVIGVGGAGCNAVNNMIAAGLTGVDFVVANTDAQALAASSAEHRVQLGINLTEGLGAGAKPEVGEAAAEEAIEDIRAQIGGSHMVFIAAGMGGGTGTGAATVIARAARDAGILTVGIVTKPFQFEGARRMRIAEAGIIELRQYVDTLIVIPNQNLFRIASEKTTFAEAFVLADQVLYSGVACIVDLIVKEGLINLDFADVRTIMSGMGTAMMGTGEASGDQRAITAAEEAISNPLLDDVSLKGAKGLLLSITGGSDLTLYEVDEAASRVRQEVDPEANIIVGATFDDTLGDRVRVSIVASGMGGLAQPANVNAAAEAWSSRGRKSGGGPGIPLGASEPVPFTSSPPAQSVPSAPPPAVQNQPAMLQPVVLEPDEGDDRDMQRRLSAALDTPELAAEQTAESSRSSATAGWDGGWNSGRDTGRDQAGESSLSAMLGNNPAGNPSTLRETRRGPGHVTIEEGLPPIKAAAPASQRWGSDATSPPPLPAGSSGGFIPAPPAELPRSSQRRMPQVEDFPQVGQREYRAKAGHGPGAAGLSAPAQPAVIEPPRREGFFERITGRMRRGSETTRAEVRGGDPYEPVARDSGMSSLAAPSAPQPARGRGGARVQEQAELPVFFARDRK